MAGSCRTFLFEAFEVVLRFLRHLHHRNSISCSWRYHTDFNVFEIAKASSTLSSVGRFLCSQKAGDARFKDNICLDSEYSKWLRTLTTTMISSTS